MLIQIQANYVETMNDEEEDTTVLGEESTNAYSYLNVVAHPDDPAPWLSPRL
jgi:hypothetical protein